MKRLALPLTAVPLLLALAGTAQAQGYPPYPGAYGPINRPALNPYLNLLRNNTSGSQLGINYYLGTLPEQQRRYNDAFFRGAITGLEARQLTTQVPATEEDIFAPAPGSGHGTAFGYYGGYYTQLGPRIGSRINTSAPPPPHGGRPPTMGKVGPE